MDTVFSVTILNVECMDIPTPPPITLPSRIASIGFLYVASR